MPLPTDCKTGYYRYIRFNRVNLRSVATMKLVLYNDYQLGVINNGNVVDAMAAVAGMTFRRPP